jgi:hypothetical protein
VLLDGEMGNDEHQGPRARIPAPVVAALKYRAITKAFGQMSVGVKTG